jgi:hypothetical protein
MAMIVLRRITIFGTPVALGALAAMHPMLPADNLVIWNLLHLMQIPLVALLGIAVVLMLDGVTHTSATVARLAVLPWIAGFAAYDATAGLATGVLAEFGQAHPEASTMVADASMAIVVSPLVLGPQLMAFLFAIVVFGGAAIALRRVGISAVAAVAIAAGGIVWSLFHPLIGAAAMLAFLLGAVICELRRGERRPAPVAAVAESPAQATGSGSF